jgi:hypothetical protein
MKASEEKEITDADRRSVPFNEALRFWLKLGFIL